MSKIRLKKKTDNFTILDNTGLRDETLSWKAKGLLAYLLHLPDDWEVYLSDLKNRSKDGRDGTASGVDELIEKGYITRVRKMNGTKFAGYDYDIHEQPVNRVGISVTENPNTENPNTENPELLSTKDTKLLNKQKTKEEDRSSSFEQFVKEQLMLLGLTDISNSAMKQLKEHSKLNELHIKKTVDYITNNNKPKKMGTVINILKEGDFKDIEYKPKTSSRETKIDFMKNKLGAKKVTEIYKDHYDKYINDDWMDDMAKTEAERDTGNDLVAMYNKTHKAG